MKELKYLLLASLLAFAPLAGCGGDTEDDPVTDAGTTDGDPVSFCDAFAEVCGGISTLDDCATWWAAAAVGTAEDMAGATQGCYTYHLGVAATDADSAAIHCPHAAGEAVCVDEATTDEGTTDEGTTDEGTTDEGTTDEGTTDEGTTDEGTTDEGTTDEGTTDEGTTDEGTTDEGTTDEGTTDEGTTDGEPATFCDTYTATCGGVMTCGANGDETCAMADCATWWAAAAVGTEADTAGATQGCYTYHLGVAAIDADSAGTHCPHANGDAVCVD